MTTPLEPSFEFPEDILQIPQSKPVMEQTNDRPLAVNRSTLQRAIHKLREDCGIYEQRALRQYERGNVDPEAIQTVVDDHIRKWLERRLLSGKYTQTYMEQTRSARHPCGDLTLATQDGATVTFLHPTAILGFHYSPMDIQRGFPLRFFCTPEVAERMRAKTLQLSELDGLTYEDWDIALEPAVGLVPVEIDPIHFTTQSVHHTDTRLSFRPKFSSKNRLSLVDPGLDVTRQLEVIRIGHAITLTDPLEIAKVLRQRPELRSNTDKRCITNDQRCDDGSPATDIDTFSSSPSRKAG